MTERVTILSLILLAVGLVWLVVEWRSPSGPVFDPRAVDRTPPPVTVVEVGGRAPSPGPVSPAPPARQRLEVEVHHVHHHRLEPPVSVPVEVIDGEVVERPLERGGS